MEAKNKNMSILRLAVSQAHTRSNTPASLFALESIAQSAAARQVDLILFPEAFIGGYPRNTTFGSTVGAQDSHGREQYLKYFQNAVDLGDIPNGGGIAWVERSLEAPKQGGERGDGTREALERIARDTDVFLIVGLVEKCAGILYSAIVYVCPNQGIIGKRRKVIPTGCEQLIWTPGQPESLRAVTTTIHGIKLTLASAISWENYMPLLRQSLYSQSVNLYLAPTSDDRETWLPLLRTIAQEGHCVVISANQCATKAHLPGWITGCQPKAPEKIFEDFIGARSHSNGNTDWSATPPLRLRRQRSEMTEDSVESVCRDGLKSPMKLRREREAEEEYVSRGGSCIVAPSGEVVIGPLWDEIDGILVANVDLDDCIRARLDLDIGGKFSRNKAFQLTVDGLDLTPPP
ncbi:BgTH12-04261 [Blumeria graminis f. sp. triticale]|nr:BgTH12-04261 [Blumeria graminis f. sp. triticale]